jgi:hypothetical protein
MKFGKTLNRGFYYGNRQANQPFRPPLPTTTAIPTLPLNHALPQPRLALESRPLVESNNPHFIIQALFLLALPAPSYLLQACCEREQVMVSKFVFPEGVEGLAAGGGTTAEGDGDKKRKESTKREDGGSEIGSQVGSNIR